MSSSLVEGPDGEINTACEEASESEVDGEDGVTVETGFSCEDVEAEDEEVGKACGTVAETDALDSGVDEACFFAVVQKSGLQC